MRWETVNRDSNQEVYQLKENNQNLLTLTLHPFSNTARLEREGEKRVFQIRKEGFLRNKTILRNEYGVKIGELGLENKENFIEVNQERFYYQISQEPKAELKIYKDNKENPILVCGLNGDSHQGEMKFRDPKDQSRSYASLLMALCWYMFLPVASQELVTL